MHFPRALLCEGQSAACELLDILQGNGNSCSRFFSIVDMKLHVSGSFLPSSSYYAVSTEQEAISIAQPWPL